MPRSAPPTMAAFTGTTSASSGIEINENPNPDTACARPAAPTIAAIAAHAPTPSIAADAST